MFIHYKKNEIHEAFHLALEGFDKKYVDDKENPDGNVEHQRTMNIIHSVQKDLFQLKNKAENKNDELKKQIKHFNKEIKKVQRKNEELSLETAGLKNSYLGAEQLLKDKESIYFATVLATVNFLIGVIALGYLICKKK